MTESEVPVIANIYKRLCQYIAPLKLVLGACSTYGNHDPVWEQSLERDTHVDLTDLDSPERCRIGLLDSWEASGFVQWLCEISY